MTCTTAPVDPRMRDNEECSRLERLLWCHVRGRIHSLWVEIHDEGLVLHGRAPSYYAKQLVQHAAMRTSSLPILANQIEVCRETQASADLDPVPDPLTN